MADRKSDRRGTSTKSLAILESPAASGSSPAGTLWSAPATDAEARNRMIAEAAYYRAEQRGFDPGHELDDWLAAEYEIARVLDAGVDRGAVESPPATRSRR
jgi:hypothetical protein